jgi:hypothetical protein
MCVDVRVVRGEHGLTAAVAVPDADAGKGGGVVVVVVEVNKKHPRVKVAAKTSMI